jgi:RNA polymerase sigma-70 factor (ECF subfamily)
MDGDCFAVLLLAMTVGLEAVIRPRVLAVTGFMNAAAAMPRDRRTEDRGMVLPFRRRIYTGEMTQAHSTSDERDHAALIEAIAQRRDRAAFGVLFGYFGPRVKAWMLRAGCPPPAAEELAQETMLAVWQKAGQFDPARAGASTWIFTIARNLRIDASRRERHPSELMLDPMPDEPVQADRVLAMTQQEVRIRAALTLLPPEQAEVIRKAFFEDKVHADIEKELGIPLGTVKSRLRLAMTRLRSMLGDFG